MTSAPVPHALDDARVEAVQRARTRWRHEVAEAGGPNTLLWHRTSLTGTFDLNLAHPGGVAKLLSGRPTLLSELVREHVAFLDASRRIGAASRAVEFFRSEDFDEEAHCFVQVWNCECDVIHVPKSRQPSWSRGEC